MQISIVGPNQATEKDDHADADHLYDTAGANFCKEFII